MDEIKSFKTLVEAARAASAGGTPPRVAVCAAEDDSSIRALSLAHGLGLASPVLVGDRAAILRIMDASGVNPDPFTIQDVPGDSAEKAERGVSLIRAGEADVLMKGMIPTSTFLHPIFRHGTGLATGAFISHVGVLEVPGMGRLLLQTDGGINIAPDIEKKKGIIINAVAVARVLGMVRPKVALLSASEKVHPKIRSAVDAAELAAWAKGAVPDADVEGPMALDIAVSEDAAKKKGLAGAVPGRADVLVAPNIEMGNVIYKALRLFANAEGAGIVVGASCPIVLTSRSDPPPEKVNSIALAVLYAMAGKR